MIRKTGLLLVLICLLAGLSACGSSSDAKETVPAGETVRIRALKLTAEESLVPLDTEEAKPSEETTQTKELPLGLVQENGKWYYYAQPGVRFRGWIRTEEGYSYFGEARREGLCRIDGDLYYFPEGIMATGPQLVRGVPMLFDEASGKLIPESKQDGWGKKNGRRFYREQGELLKGLVTLEGEQYLFDEEGYLLTGKQQLEDAWYYFKESGEMAFGLIEENGSCYFAGEEGELQSGFIRQGEVLRYFDPESFEMLRNTAVGAYWANAQGHCEQQAVEITDANLDAYVDSILAQIGKDPRAIYDYVCQNYVYTTADWDSVRNMAIYMFNKGYGACIHYCAVTEMLLNHSGYATQWVRGELGHYWLLVEMEPGVWRHMDTMRKNYHVYNLTDDELLAKHDNPYDVNFRWDTTRWTSTTASGNGSNPPTSRITMPGEMPASTAAEPETENTEAAAAESTAESLPEETLEEAPAQEGTEESREESAPEAGEGPAEPSETPQAGQETEESGALAETTEASPEAGEETSPEPAETPAEESSEEAQAGTESQPAQETSPAP